MAKVINLTHVTQRATRPNVKPVGRINGPKPIKGRRNCGGGFKHHGHEASRVICNRNMKYAGVGIIWTTV